MWVVSCSPGTGVESGDRVVNMVLGVGRVEKTGRGPEGHIGLNAGVLGLSDIRGQKSWGPDRLVFVARSEDVGVCNF